MAQTHGAGAGAGVESVHVALGTPRTPARKPASSGEDAAGFFSQLFFSWVTPLLTRGVKLRGALHAYDLWPLSRGDTAHELTQATIQGMSASQADVDATAGMFGREPVTPAQFARIVATLARARMGLSAIAMVLYCAASLCSPILLRGLVQSIADGDGADGSTSYDALYFSVVLFLVQFGGAVANHQQLHHSTRIGQRVRSLVMALVYRKTLEMTTSQRQRISGGTIATLVSTDSQKFFDMFPMLHLIWALPILIGTATGFLVWLIGVLPALIGVAVLSMLVPLNVAVGRATAALRRDHMAATDARVKLCQEVLEGMRVVKLFCWERQYTERIEKLRAVEVKCARREAVLFAVSISLLISLPVVAVVVAFSVYTLVNDTPLSAGNAFAALGFFNVLRFPLMNMSVVLSTTIQCMTALTRLTTFLSQPGTAAASNLLPAAPRPEAEQAEADEEEDAESSDGAEHNGEEGEGAVVTTAATKSKSASALAGSSSYSIQVQNADFGWSVVHDDAEQSESGGQGSSQGPDSNGSVSHTNPVASAATAATASAAQPELDVVLRDVSFNASPGELVVVIGAVGSGKSTLMSALVHEAAVAKGSVSVRGKVALATQQAWIQNATVRDNICFAQKFDSTKFKRVIRACALEPDLKQLPGAEYTEVGEKGLTLSGGQKQRLALARAAYVGADVFLFDDPLSALDASTGRHIFQHLLGPRGLLRHTTRVLVTHALETLNASDTVVVLHGGRMAFAGSFPQLQEATSAHAQLQVAPSHPVPPGGAQGPDTDSSAGAGAGAGAGTSESKHTEGTAAVVTATPRSGRGQTLGEVMAMLSHVIRDETQQRRGRATSVASSQSDGGSALARQRSASLARSGSFGDPEVSVDRAKAGELMTTETRVVGTVAGAVYRKYLAAGGGCLMAMFLFMGFLLERTSFLSIDWWLSWWVSATEDPARPFGLPYINTTLPAEDVRDDSRYYASGYATLCAINIAAVVLRTVVFASIGVTASDVLFRNMLRSVMGAPMSFFDTTPLGRIVSRFSFDTDTIDFILITRVMSAVASMWWLLCAFVILLAIVPGVLLVLLPVMVLYWLLQYRYRFSSRALQRLDNVSRSPIQARLSETLNGAPTIRAFQAVGRFVEAFNSTVDANAAAVFAYHASTRWVGVNIEVLGASVTLATGIGCWLARNSLAGGFAGLAITWAFNLTISLNFNVINLSEAEARMSSVERVVEYTDLPKERPLVIEDQKPPPSWPRTGRVEFKDVVLRYRKDLDPALNGLSVVIEGGERVAVVGRTGAGKSTLATALFRLVELDHGSVVVDGVDLSNLGLEDVRGRGMAIIPQDPVLFSGTLLDNLDPFQEFSSRGAEGMAAIQRAVDLVRMTDPVAAAGGLTCQVREGGSNFSVGERQLLCLARALLRDPRVLVLDEATASVDHDTDAFIQTTVRQAFSSTLITIAHRLQTVTDYDKVLVMEKGRCVEFDTPLNLIEANPPGYFASLVDAAGLQAALRLRASIREAATAQRAEGVTA